MADQDIKNEDAKWLRSPSTKSNDKFSPTNPSWLTPSPAKSTGRDSPVESVKPSNNKRRIIVQTEDKGLCCGLCPSDPVLYWFIIFHIFSGLTGLSSLLANAYVLTQHDLSFVNLVLHVYAILLCMIVLFAEINFTYVLSLLRFLDYWIFRGLFYAFIGFLTMSQEGFTFDSFITTPVTVISIIQISFGLMYFLMGITCVQNLQVRRSLNRTSQQQYIEIPDTPSPAGSVLSLNTREIV